MESVIISIKPEWLEKIIRGEKTIEVRKSAPKEVPFGAYIYCTKSNEYEVTVDEIRDDGKARHHNGKGKVVAMFVCDKIYTLDYLPNEYSGKFGGEFEEMICDKACLSYEEIMRYKGNKTAYGWHITDLRIFPRPQDLSIYSGRKRVLKGEKVEIEEPCICIFGRDKRLDWKPVPLTRPPQSWQYLF